MKNLQSLLSLLICTASVGVLAIPHQSYHADFGYQPAIYGSHDRLLDVQSYGQMPAARYGSSAGFDVETLHTLKSREADPFLTQTLEKRGKKKKEQTPEEKAAAEKKKTDEANAREKKADEKTLAKAVKADEKAKAKSDKAKAKEAKKEAKAEAKNEKKQNKAQAKLDKAEAKHDTKKINKYQGQVNKQKDNAKKIQDNSAKKVDKINDTRKKAFDKNEQKAKDGAKKNREDNFDKDGHAKAKQTIASKIRNWFKAHWIDFVSGILSFIPDVGPIIGTALKAVSAAKKVASVVKAGVKGGKEVAKNAQNSQSSPTSNMTPEQAAEYMIKESKIDDMAKALTAKTAGMNNKRQPVLEEVEFGSEATEGLYEREAFDEEVYRPSRQVYRRSMAEELPRDKVLQLLRRRALRARLADVDMPSYAMYR